MKQVCSRPLPEAPDLADLRRMIEEGSVLLHGLSLDALTGVFHDRKIASDVRADGWTSGVSLTRSFEVAMDHARSQEDMFDDVLCAHYGCGRRPGAGVGAVLVFPRAGLAGLELEAVDDLGGDVEKEERVAGTLDRLQERVLAVIVDPVELDWFAGMADTVFRSVDGEVQWVLDAVAAIRGFAVAGDGLGAHAQIPAAAASVAGP